MKDASKQSSLKGVRVLDLTRGWAGPIGGRFLADFGAEVIKIEAPTGRGLVNVDPPQPLKYMRVVHAPYPNNDPGDEPYNRYAPFNEYHRNKLSLSLDLTAEECKEIFRNLVLISDVVLENYSARVMRNFGFDYPSLKKLNPSIIMVSMPGFGTYGPQGHFVSYGSDIEPNAGITHLMGYAGSGPMRHGEAYADPSAGVHAASAMVTALFHRRRTGKGQYVDLSQSESMIGLIGEHLMAYSMNREEPERMGNRHPVFAPHGCYRCRGDDKWVAISVENDEEWTLFCEVLGSPEWTQDEKFANQEGRRDNWEELDANISRWTADKDYKEVMHSLQSRGIAAGAVFTNQDVAEDPHLKERGYIWDVPHAKAGTMQFLGAPILLSRTPVVLHRPAPTLGEHNGYVVTDLLGMEAAHADLLEEAGLMVTRPPV